MFSLIRRPSVARAIIAANLSMFLFALIAVAVLLTSQNRLKVHGPVYDSIKASADLTADILPPPLYLMETFLTVSQIKSTEDDAERQRLVAHLNELEKDFKDRRNYWAGQDLPADIRNSLQQRVVPDAQAIFDEVRTRFMPALLARRGNEVAAAVATIGTLYARHRDGIEELVKLANRSVEAAEASATATETFYLRVTYAVLTLTLVVAVGAIVVLVGMIARPIRLMTDAMRALAGGDKSITVPAIGRRDEIGSMAAAVEVFKQNAIERARLEAEQKEQEARSTEEKKAALIGMAEKIESATGTALESVGTRTAAIAATAQEMSASASRTGVSAQGAASAAGHALANAQTVASAAEQLAASIREIGGQVNQSNAVVGRAVAAGNETRTKMEALNEQVGRIGTVADMISEIAAKTNLLALNATIEAARAGDAGKGFAVVASEVKQLATQTARSTQEIARHIGEVRAATGASVASVRQIEQTIGEINSIAGSIAAAVEEQGAATAEIARNVAETAAAANEMTRRINEVSAEAEQTGQHSAQVRDDTASLNSMVGELKHSVAHVVRTSTTEVDRRQSVRYPMALPCQVTVAGLGSQSATITDLSEGGASLSGGPALRVGTRGTLDADRIGMRLPFVVRAADGKAAHLAFELDTAAARRLAETLERLGLQHAA